MAQEVRKGRYGDWVFLRWNTLSVVPRKSTHTAHTDFAAIQDLHMLSSRHRCRYRSSTQPRRTVSSAIFFFFLFRASPISHARNPSCVFWNCIHHDPSYFNAVCLISDLRLEKRLNYSLVVDNLSKTVPLFRFDCSAFVCFNQFSLSLAHVH